MIRWHIFKYDVLLKVCLFLILLIPQAGLAQENSEIYLSIKNSNKISNLSKEKKIDSLFVVYEREKKLGVLAIDLYDYAKWQYKNGKIDKAIEISNKCTRIIDTLKSFDENIHKRAVNNLGFFYGKKRDYVNALNSFKKLTTIGKKDKSTASAYRLVARYFRYLGDFYKASEYYETSIAIAKEVNNTAILLTNSTEASINYKQIASPESLERGIEILTDAVLLVDSLTKKSKSIGDKISLKKIVILYDQLGNLYNDRDDYNFIKSKNNYDKAITIASKLNDSLLLALVYTDLGYLYLHDNKKETLYYLNKALQHEPDIETVSIIYANKSAYFSELGNKEEALRAIQQSINALTPISVDDFESLPSKEEVSVCNYKYELVTSLIEKANVWLKFSDNTKDKTALNNALKTFQLADYLVDVIRFESSEQQSKLYWRKVASEIYANAVKTCYYLNQPNEGLYFMEKNKALLLLEGLSLKQQKERANLPNAINERQLFLKTQIFKNTTLLNKTSLKKDSIRLLLLKTKEQYTSFIDSLEMNYEVYYRAQKPAVPLTLNEIKQKALTNDEVYIEYILGDDDGFGMLISKTGSKFFKIKEFDALAALAKKFRGFLETPLNTKEDSKEFHKVAALLYNSLFPASISQEILRKKLIVIPDAYLQNIPFEAFQVSDKPGSYFIKQNDISYAYSITFLNQNKSWQRNNTNDFLGFAPVYFHKGLSDLPLSKTELAYPVSQFSSEPFLFDKATKQNFIKNIKNHRIVHIASHSDASDTKSPWIAFSDKKLTLDELYLTENTADLVVLSACKTSLGLINKGEGVMSLARGFFNTGTNSVLSTLWNVNDKSSTEIITKFYEEIEKGKTKSEALRFAKLNYINNHQLSEQSPYYWSSFILLGDTGKIPLENNNLLFIAIVISAILVFMVFLYYKKVKK